MSVKMNPTQEIYLAIRQPLETAAATTILGAVVTDRFYWAAFHRFLAKAFFFGRLRLFVDERMTAIVIPFEIGGRGLTAKIAVDALLIHIEFAGGIFGILIGDVSHKFPGGAGS
jgi:hypothetical protein